MRPILISAALLLSPAAFGKCAINSYLLSGSILDSSGKVLPNVSLRVQWLEQGNHQQELETTAGPDGAYSLTIPFYPHSGQSLLGSDRCTAKLHSVNIRIGSQTQAVNLTGQVTSLNLVVAQP